MTDAIVEIKHLSREFSGRRALTDVSLTIPKGQVLGLVGENGAGKTTLLKHLLGLFRAQAGSVRVFGFNPADSPEKVLSRIGFLSEDRDLPMWMRIDQLMNFTSGFFPDWDHRYASELVEMFELKTDQRLKSLSRGQLARVGLLVALAHRPELLLLDEPSSGLDPVVRRDILSAIIRTVADDGRTVLFSSHLLDEVQRVADHVAMLHHGRLLMSDRLETVLEQHVRFTIRFAQAADAAPDIPGVVSCEGEGAEWSLLCNGQQAATRTWLSNYDVEILNESAPSLDEIFVARVSQSD